MRYELKIEFACGKSMKERFCNFDDMKKTKREILTGESDYKLTITPLYLFF